jgi:TRAP-type C4-dicarboxylate transport system permease large subunit
MVLVMAAAALGWCLSISRVPQTLTPIILSTITSPIEFMLISNLLMLIIGCFMEALAALLILIPLLVPMAVSYGIDPVQFGVVMVLNLILGTIHPPIGVVLFVVTRIANVPFELLSRAICPAFRAADVPLAISVWPPLTKLGCRTSSWDGDLRCPDSG